MDELRPDSKRQSYIFVAKGRGPRYEYTDVLESYDMVRKLLYKQHQDIQCLVANLECTHARMVTEAQNTKSQHVELWERYAEFLQSEFERYSMDNSECEWVCERLQKYKARKMKCIYDLVSIQCQNTNEPVDPPETISQLHRAQDMEIYR